MNNARRKTISRIITELDNIIPSVEEVRDEEQDYFDNMPEGIQAGEKGELADAAAQALDEAFEAINEAISRLNEALA